MRALGLRFSSRHGKGARMLNAFAFDRDTALEASSAPHTYTGFVTDRWSVGDAPNGGLLTALAVSAARKELRYRDPLSFGGHFVAKVQENASIDAVVTVLHSGRSTETVSVALKQENALKAQFLGTFGDLSRFSGFTALNNKAPALPPRSECLHASPILRKFMGDKLKIANVMDFYVPSDSPFAKTTLANKTGSVAELRGWGRFEDGRPLCLRSLALFCDAFPPPVLNLQPAAWVPTIEYTVHFRSRPDTGPAADPWLRFIFTSRHVVNGLLETDSELWSADGMKLLAQGRQLARILRPQPKL